MKPLALACVCVKEDGHYTIQKAHHENKIWSERINGISYHMDSARPIWNAGIEGVAGEMNYIAAVIEDWEWGECSFKRCGIIIKENSAVLLSPRNSNGEVCEITVECAKALGRSIDFVVSGKGVDKQELEQLIKQLEL